MRNRIAALLLPAVAAALLAGCSDASSTSSSGGVECDPGAFSGALSLALQESLMTVDSIDGFECADDWAVVQATVSGEQMPAVQEQYLLAVRDAEWVLRSPEGSCGTMVDAVARPSDAAVPESLWEQACGELAEG